MVRSLADRTVQPSDGRRGARDVPRPLLRAADEVLAEAVDRDPADKGLHKADLGGFGSIGLNSF